MKRQLPYGVLKMDAYLTKKLKHVPLIDFIKEQIKLTTKKSIVDGREHTIVTDKKARYRIGIKKYGAKDLYYFSQHGTTYDLNIYMLRQYCDVKDCVEHCDLQKKAS